MWKLLNKHTSVSFNNNWGTFLLFTFSSARKCLTSHTLQNNIVPSVENTFSPHCVTYSLKRLEFDTFCFGISIALRKYVPHKSQVYYEWPVIKQKIPVSALLGELPNYRACRGDVHWFLIYWDGHCGFTLRCLGVKRQHSSYKKTLKWTFKRRR